VHVGVRSQEGMAMAAAVVEVALPPKLLNSHILPVHQQIAGSVWAAWVVGGMSAGVQLCLVVLPPSLGVGAAGWCCVVALCCGPAVASGLHDTGMGMGHCWHLHGVGLAGAWVWGAVGTCPVWSGPGWCSGHWCGLAMPRNVEVTAVSGNNCVHFHHITPGVELEDHQLAHILATSTRVEAGGVPVISADFARCGAVTRMLEGWNSLFQSKKYIGSNFLTL
jgi:hypothetical protein